MPNLEYLIEKEVVPVLKDIADSLKKIANPLIRVSDEEKEWQLKADRALADYEGKKATK